VSDVSWALRLDLFRWALLAALVAGLVCPLIGSLLLVRRTSFYGITLPQFATAGVVFGFLVMPWWIAHIGLGDLDLETALGSSHAAMNYHLLWAALFTFGGLLLLVVLGRRGGSEIARVAAAFAVANAATILFGRLSPVGKSFVDDLLVGEVLGVGRHELEVLAGGLGIAALATLWLLHDLVLVSFDRETARVLGRNVLALEGLLNVLVGLTVAVGTMILGPTLLFGLLVVPPLAARSWARSMSGFLWLSVGLGALAVLGGVVASFELDLPLGAAIVGVAGLELLPSGARRLLRR
jgi:ABC-type Mn2+/Zn2+ transport system permease subunit